MLKLDLTQEKIRPLSIKDEQTGQTVRFTFSRILNRQQRTTMTKKVGKGTQAREIADLERLFRTCMASMGPVEVSGIDPSKVDENGIITDPDLIAQIMLIPENRDGLPEEMVAQVVSYLTGENVLGEDRGNV